MGTKPLPSVHLVKQLGNHPTLSPQARMSAEFFSFEIEEGTCRNKNIRVEFFRSGLSMIGGEDSKRTIYLYGSEELDLFIEALTEFKEKIVEKEGRVIESYRKELGV